MSWDYDERSSEEEELTRIVFNCRLQDYTTSCRVTAPGFMAVEPGDASYSQHDDGEMNIGSQSRFTPSNVNIRVDDRFISETAGPGEETYSDQYYYPETTSYGRAGPVWRS